MNGLPEALLLRFMRGEDIGVAIDAEGSVHYRCDDGIDSHACGVDGETGDPVEPTDAACEWYEEG